MRFAIRQAATNTALFQQSRQMFFQLSGGSGSLAKAPARSFATAVLAEIFWRAKILRKRLKLTDEQFSSVLRKSGISISAIAKEAATLK